MKLVNIAKILVLLTIVIVAQNVKAREAGNSEFDWDSLMDAITQVESGGNPKAVNGNQCGAMQITPVLVRDCNEILKARGEKKRYTLRDRFSVKKSREMFVLIQSKYNPNNNIEQAIRLWNGGAKYKKKSTQKYYAKVMRELQKQENA